MDSKELDDKPVIPSASFRAHLSRFSHSPSPSRKLASPSLAPPLPSPPPVTPQKRATAPNSSPTRMTSPHFNSKKRPVTDLEEATEEVKPKKKSTPKKIRPYAPPALYAHLDGLTDCVRPGLDVLICGINPGCQSAATGNHYAHPTNHFYKCLHGSGFTDRLITPAEGCELPMLCNMGMTNLVSRPTAEASELSTAELRESVPGFLAKVIALRPKIVAFTGMEICRTVMRHLHNLPPSPSEPSTPPEIHLVEPAPSSTTPTWSTPSPSPPPKPVKTTPPRSTPSKRRVAMPKVSTGLQPFTLSYPDPEISLTKRRFIYFVSLPSPSARVIAFQIPEKIREFKILKAHVDRLSADPSCDLEFQEGATQRDIPVEWLKEVIDQVKSEVKEEETAVNEVVVNKGVVNEVVKIEGVE